MLARSLFTIFFQPLQVWLSNAGSRSDLSRTDLLACLDLHLTGLRRPVRSRQGRADGPAAKLEGRANG
jgi:hypothetical protein